MEKLVIKGNTRLLGSVTISGAKNAAVAIIPACLLIDGPTKLENLPDIKDVKLYLDILENMGASVERIDKTTVIVDTSKVTSTCPDEDMARKMRGSSYLIGALLGRSKACEVAMPGGCDFGSRPIDQHIKGFEALGANVEILYGKVHAKTQKLIGANVYFDIVTVGATVNVILAAAKAEGMTIIENAAKEPHIVDLANFLNAMGANIRGAGTDTIKIKGVPSLHGGTYSIIPDQIEAGTFMIAAAATRGDVTIKNVIPRHLEPITAKLVECGVDVEEFDDEVRIFVREDAILKKISFIALPYPGYPTDMQPQMVAFLSTVPGSSSARDGVWDNRFRYVDELKLMGANIRVEGNLALIDGVPKLMGAPVRATDLRAGAAMIIAGLVADGYTEISDIYHIDRGYDNFEEKFIGLGAEISRVEVIDS